MRSAAPASTSASTSPRCVARSSYQLVADAAQHRRLPGARRFTIAAWVHPDRDASSSAPDRASAPAGRPAADGLFFGGARAVGRSSSRSTSPAPGVRATAALPRRPPSPSDPLLLLCVTVRPARDIVIAVDRPRRRARRRVRVCAASTTPPPSGPAFVTIALAVAPPLLGVQIVRSLRTARAARARPGAGAEHGQLPRATRSACWPREELARLDLAAERLLDGVATRTHRPPPRRGHRLGRRVASPPSCACTSSRADGRPGCTTRSPSPPCSARRSRSATRTASPASSPATSATACSPRSGCSSATRCGRAPGSRAKLQLDRRTARRATKPDGPQSACQMPIVISATGVPRNGVDPAAWQAIRKVGRYVESFSGSTLRIEIDSVADNPADL